MKNIFRGMLVGIVLSEAYRILKKKGVFNACKNGCNDFVSKYRKKRKHVEYDAGKGCNYFGE